MCRKSLFLLEAWVFSILICGKHSAADSLDLLYDDGQGNTMPYRLFLPPEHDVNQEYPLVLALHGRGTRGTDNVSQLVPFENLITATRSPEYASFLIAPQAPLESLSWYELHWTDLLEGIMDEVRQQYLVNPRQLYVTGQSMGGWGTVYQMCLFPDQYAAGVPVASGFFPEHLNWVAPLIKDVPIWVFHGEEDPTVPVEYSRDLVQALEDAGGSPRYTEYVSLGHNISDTVYAEPELYSWMFSQQLSLEQEMGDFDVDGDVDGFDFLKWQRGESPNPLSQTDLTNWQVYFGVLANPIVAASTGVPEPTTGLLLMLGMAALLFRRHLEAS